MMRQFGVTAAVAAMLAALGGMAGARGDGPPRVAQKKMVLVELFTSQG